MPRKTTDAPMGDAAPSPMIDPDSDAAARREPPAGIDDAGGALDRARDRVRETAHDYADTARRWAGERIEEQRGRLDDLADRGRRYVGDVAERGSADLARRRSAVEGFVADNPALVGVVGLAAGLLLGALLPRTTREDRTFGPYADDARDQGLRYARDAMHSGRAYVEAALDEAEGAIHRAADDLQETSASGLRSGPSGRYQNH